jgi:hypothetical protein
LTIKPGILSAHPAADELPQGETDDLRKKWGSRFPPTTLAGCGETINPAL